MVSSNQTSRTSSSERVKQVEYSIHSSRGTPVFLFMEAPFEVRLLWGFLRVSASLLERLIVRKWIMLHRPLSL